MDLANYLSEGNIVNAAELQAKLDLLTINDSARGTEKKGNDDDDEREDITQKIFSATRGISRPYLPSI